MYASPGSGLERAKHRRLRQAVCAIGLLALALTLVASAGAASTASVDVGNATEIDHCMELTSGGEYVLTQDLQPSAPENLTLDTAEYPRSACIAVNASGVVIDGQGYEIDGTAAHANGSGQYYGIRVQNLSAAAGTDDASALSPRLTNVTLTNWSRSVYAYNAPELYVNDSTIQSDLSGQTSALYLRYSDNATLHSNVVDGHARGVELFGASTDVNVTHNEITNTSIAGIAAEGDRLLVANNHVEDYGGSLGASGIELDEVEDARVVDNVVLDGYRAITAYGGPADDVSILNNTLRDGEKAILFEDAGVVDSAPSSATVVLRNNTIEQFADGFSILQVTASPTLVDNVVRNVTDEGFALFDGSDNGLVESNVVTASGTGLLLRADHTTVRDNDLSGNDRAVDVRRSTDSTISSNDLSGSSTVGAYLLGLNGGTVLSDNAITDGAGTGVEITVLNDDASDVVLERNEITRNLGAGVVIQNENAPNAPGPRNPVFRGNNVSANGAEGIFDGDGVNATYADNRVANNAEQGIAVVGFARNATVRNNTVVGNGGVGIQLGNAPNVDTENHTVTQNSLTNNTDHAILVEEAPGVVLANNSMSDHDVDLRLHHASGVAVRDNTFGTGIAIGVEDDGDFVHDVTGNAFHDGSPLFYAAGDAAPNVPQDARQVIVVDADGLVLSDLNVTTNGVPTGLLVATSNGSTIENVSVIGPARQGVRFVSVANATVDGVTIDGARGGIDVETSPGIALRNASVTNVDEAAAGNGVGIRVTDSSGASILDSYVHNTSRVGIATANAAGFLLASSAVDETGGRGVLVSQSAGTTVRMSAIEDATYSGMLLDGASNSTVDEVIVTNSPSATTGIRAIDSDEVTLLDNHVQGIGGEGIVTGDSANVTITGTFAYGNAVGIAVGVVTSGGEANAVLRRNDLSQNDVGLDGQQVAELVNNTITDSTNEGATVANSDGATITENLIVRSGGTGLALDGLSTATVANNEFDDNDVAIEDTGSIGLLIDTNTLRNHDTQAVELYGSDEFTVRNNTIASTVDSDGFGISAGVRTELASGDVGTIADNTFDANDYGIQVAAENTDLLGANLTIRDNTFANNPEGVMVYDEADEIVIADNAFNGTTGDAVAYGASSPAHYLDARQNWWDAADGPSGSEADPVTGTVANGSGDAVGANVRFDPWLGDDSSVGGNLSADISVVSASVNATDVQPNDSVTVSADVRNTGNTTGSYSADLEIDGSVVDTVTLDVAPSVTETVVFTYPFTDAGDYTVTVDGVTAGTVSVAGSGSGSGGDDGGDGDDGGGGGGGFVPPPAPAPAPEPSVTVENTSAGAEVTVSDASAGDAVTAPLDGAVQTDAFELTALSITLADAVDLTATITAQANAPADAGDLPNGATALGYFEVGHDLDDDQIESTTVEFTVSTAALDARGIDAEDVVLYHAVDGEWVERETTVVEERADAVDLRADVPHFSWFAVAGTQPSFAVDASLATTELQTGGTASVEAIVTNDGSTAGSTDVTLSIDGEPVDSETVALDAGEQATVAFEYGFDTAGEYEIAVDGSVLGTVTVDAPESGDGTDAAADEGSDDADGQETDSGSGDGSPGFGLAAALVALIGAALLAVRRTD